ncbi:PepSY domain-containing protein [Achromobacter sp. GG226]|uniref:PepSY-associated TM helix domain-containing protein n=1 Tax=Verticiella alkaliphila TaxID=2779529 RepID=UPI001C0B8B0B|nr:PepSY-associated TM helix domain-containing protein [Verticiella sp. GG226]MBU4612407.1 PepSY domain-containing protein [Verticiella sp. GG226]
MSTVTTNETRPLRQPRAPKPPGIRQTMSDLHIWAGLLVGWILYAMFLTGTVSYFKDEISSWMRPELPHVSQREDVAVVAQRVADRVPGLAPGTTQFSYELPDSRNGVIDAFWRSPEGGRRGFGSATLDPATGEALAKSRETRGGDFFYRFHFQLHYLPIAWGRWIAGLCAMFMLVAIVSGIITHKKIFADFFTFRWGKGQRSWLDGHAALSVFGLPFHLMITYSGLVTLMFMYMPWGENVAYQTAAERRAASAELSSFVSAEKPAGQPAPLASVADMVRQAQARWGEDRIGRVQLNNPGDAAARVMIVRNEAGRTSASPVFMTFDGTTGTLIEVKDRVGGAAETRGVLYALHLGRFSDTVTRWLYFMVSLAGTAMVGSGLVLWVVKRRQKLAPGARPHLGLRLVERLNVPAIAGLSLAMTSMLWANRLLPVDMAGRATWEVDVMFIVWALTLVWALVRPVRRAWIELLWASAAALALLPVLNLVTTDRGLPSAIARGDWTFAGLDFALLGLAALHAALAMRVARHKPRVKAAAARQPTRAAPPAGDTPARITP